MKKHHQHTSGTKGVGESSTPKHSGSIRTRASREHTSGTKGDQDLRAFMPNRSNVKISSRCYLLLRVSAKRTRTRARVAKHHDQHLGNQRESRIITFQAREPTQSELLKSVFYSFFKSQPRAHELERELRNITTNTSGTKGSRESSRFKLENTTHSELLKSTLSINHAKRHSNRSQSTPLSSFKPRTRRSERETSRPTPREPKGVKNHHTATSHTHTLMRARNITINTSGTKGNRESSSF